MNLSRQKPGRIWYIAAAAIAFAGCIGGAAMAWRAFTLITDVEQFLAPGSVAVEVAAPGDYLLWHNYRTVFKGRAYSAEKSLPDGVRFRVDGPGGAVTVSGTHGTTSTIGETESVSVASFPAITPGRYEVAVEGEFPARVFSVGPDNLGKGFALIFGGVGVAMLAIIAGVAFGAWVYLKNNPSVISGEGKGGATMNTAANDPDHAAKQLATLVYALQAASFLVGITFIAAVIVNYLKRDEVAGTWLESHFDWQIKTFWWSFLWGVLGLVLMVVVVGIFILIADAIWVLYRIVKGWLNLNDGKTMYG